MITIVDYGMGNLGSVKNMIKKIGGDSIITSDSELIKDADKIILPGVGAFDNGMANLKNLGLIDLLNKKVIIDKTPVLGICLGMQLMTQSSEEGTLKGLGWFAAETIKFNSEGIRVPHMGWNTAEVVKESKLSAELYAENRFYFVHSYYVKCHDEGDILMKTNYGADFASAISRENMYAVQFHPEKSHKFGYKILKNFMELV